MHPEILHKKQLDLLPYIKSFHRVFYMAGGTSIALHIGHRRSLDLDLFCSSPLSKSRIKSKLRQIPFRQIPLFEDYDQIHLMINDVKTTFFSFPYPIEHPVKIESYITIPELITLAAMKAFALGRRAKWKDYVDLYFILKHYYSINDISKKGKAVFGSQFSEKQFREQLAFYKDIDFSEPVEYLGKKISEKEIKKFLTEKAIEL